MGTGGTGKSFVEKIQNKLSNVSNTGEDSPTKSPSGAKSLVGKMQPVAPVRETSGDKEGGATDPSQHTSSPN